MFEFIKTELEGLVIIKPQVFGDNRGFFMESYKKSEFIKNGITADFVQDNHSKSAFKVLRGLHFQHPPFQQAKLVRCVKGKILDIAVDIRLHSETFGKYIKIELSEENKTMFYIPAGFAHGFVTLSEEAELFYKTDNEYAPAHECGIVWNDPYIGIEWGIDFEPILSEKDKKLPTLKEWMKG